MADKYKRKFGPGLPSFRLDKDPPGGSKRASHGTDSLGSRSSFSSTGRKAKRSAFEQLTKFTPSGKKILTPAGVPLRNAGRTRKTSKEFVLDAKIRPYQGWLTEYSYHQNCFGHRSSKQIYCVFDIVAKEVVLVNAIDAALIQVNTRNRLIDSARWIPFAGISGVELYVKSETSTDARFMVTTSTGIYLFEARDQLESSMWMSRFLDAHDYAEDTANEDDGEPDFVEVDPFETHDLASNGSSSSSAPKLSNLRGDDKRAYFQQQARESLRSAAPVSERINQSSRNLAQLGKSTEPRDKNASVVIDPNLIPPPPPAAEEEEEEVKKPEEAKKVVVEEEEDRKKVVEASKLSNQQNHRPVAEQTSMRIKESNSVFRLSPTVVTVQYPDFHKEDIDLFLLAVADDDVLSLAEVNETIFNVKPNSVIIDYDVEVASAHMLRELERKHRIKLDKTIRTVTEESTKEIGAYLIYANSPYSATEAALRQQRQGQGGGGPANDRGGSTLSRAFSSMMLQTSNLGISRGAGGVAMAISRNVPGMHKYTHNQAAAVKKFENKFKFRYKDDRAVSSLINRIPFFDEMGESELEHFLSDIHSHQEELMRQVRLGNAAVQDVAHLVHLCTVRGGGDKAVSQGVVAQAQLRSTDTAASILFGAAGRVRCGIVRLQDMWGVLERLEEFAEKKGLVDLECAQKLLERGLMTLNKADVCEAVGFFATKAAAHTVQTLHFFVEAKTFLLWLQALQVLLGEVSDKSPALQTCALRILDLLSDVIRVGKETVLAENYNIDSSVAATIMSNLTSEDIVVRGNFVLSQLVLVSESETVALDFVYKNAHLAVLAAMKANPRNLDVARSGVLALLALSKFLKVRRYLIESGAAKAVFEAAERFHKDDALLVDAVDCVGLMLNVRVSGALLPINVNVANVLVEKTILRLLKRKKQSTVASPTAASANKGGGSVPPSPNAAAAAAAASGRNNDLAIVCSAAMYTLANFERNDACLVAIKAHRSLLDLCVAYSDVWQVQMNTALTLITLLEAAQTPQLKTELLGMGANLVLRDAVYRLDGVHVEAARTVKRAVNMLLEREDFSQEMRFHALVKQKRVLTTFGRSYDVVVIGGGLAGLGIAIEASTKGKSVLLLEKYDPFATVDNTLTGLPERARSHSVAVPLGEEPPAASLLLHHRDSTSSTSVSPNISMGRKTVANSVSGETVAGDGATVVSSSTPGLPPRYRPELGASFKCAGMLNILHAQERVDDLWVKLTTRAFKGLGVPVMEGGGMSLLSDGVERAVGDLVGGRRVDNLSEFRARCEPHLIYSNIKGLHYDDAPMKADPEKTMRVLYDRARELGVHLHFGEEIETITHGQTIEMIHFQNQTAGFWNVGTAKSFYVGKNLVVAAGPASRELMRRFFGLEIPTKAVLGLVAELEERTAKQSTASSSRRSSDASGVTATGGDGGGPSLVNGLVLGSNSALTWAVRPVGKRAHEATRRGGDSTTPPLFCVQHGGRLLVGGPCVDLPEGYTEQDLDPRKYRAAMSETLLYAKKLIDLEGWRERGSWGGVMAETTDSHYPLVGPVGNGFSNLFLSTGFGTAGFREGFGAGVWLAKMIFEHKGVPWEDPHEREDDTLRHALPASRLRPVARKQGPQVKTFFDYIGLGAKHEPSKALVPRVREEEPAAAAAKKAAKNMKKVHKS